MPFYGDLFWEMTNKSCYFTLMTQVMLELKHLWNEDDSYQIGGSVSFPLT